VKYSLIKKSDVLQNSLPYWKSKFKINVATLCVRNSTHQWHLWLWVRVWGADRAVGTWWAREKRTGPWGVRGLPCPPDPHHDYPTVRLATTATPVAWRRRAASTSTLSVASTTPTVRPYVGISRRQKAWDIRILFTIRRYTLCPGYGFFRYHHNRNIVH
jgi:hypothetical protein